MGIMEDEAIRQEERKVRLKVDEEWREKIRAADYFSVCAEARLANAKSQLFEDLHSALGGDRLVLDKFLAKLEKSTEES
jgi:hypothetical protein